MNKKIIIAGILVHLLAAVFSVGYFQVDEHFQILEFTAFKLGVAEEGDLAWEFHSQIRPAIQPSFAFAIIKILNIFAPENPFYQAMVLRIISAILSLGCMWLLLHALSPEIKSDYLKRWFFFLSLLIWFLPYIHVRFSAENWTGIAFWSGFALLLTTDIPNKGINKKYIKELIIGVLFGFSFILRYQTGIMFGGIFIWLAFIKKDKLQNLSVILIGFLLSTSLGFIIDYWFYGEWTFTIWNYFNINLLQDKISRFGIAPWWYYFEEIVLKGMPPYSLFIIFSTLIVWIFLPKHPLTWATIPFITVHFLIGHKELRFLFPLINILPFVVVLSIQIIAEDLRLEKLKRGLKRIEKPFVRLFIIINSICLLVVCFKPADMQIYLYQYIYDHYVPESTELLYIGRNPFARAIPLNFYKNKKLKTVRINTVDEIRDYISNTDKKILFATLNFKLDPEMGILNCSAVYHTLPEFVKYFNLNNWMDRTPLWSLYECTLPETEKNVD